MVNRHHIPVTITTTEEMGRDEVNFLLDELLIELEYDPEVYRAYVEGDKLSEDEKTVLLEKIFSVSSEELAGAVESVEPLTKE